MGRASPAWFPDGTQGSSGVRDVAAWPAGVVGCELAVGQVIAFAELVRMRRQRVARAVHVRCCMVIATSVVTARDELARAPARERAVRVARLRKLEQLEQYVNALG